MSRTGPNKKTHKAAKKKSADDGKHEEHAESRGRETMANADSAEERLMTTADMEKELSALKDRLLRLQADFDNYRKRVIRERNDLIRRANENLLLEILPVIDHLEIGLETARAHKTQPAVVEGFDLVYEQLLGALRKSGVEPIDAEDAFFDPHQHECVSHLPSESVPADKIIAQTRRGYKLGDFILRAAQVVVSSGPAEGNDENHERVEA